MGASIWVIVLRLIHIVCGVVWVGGIVFLARFLHPMIKALGPAGGPVMRDLMQRQRLPVFLNAVGGLTMLSGFFLYGRMSMLTAGQWARTPTGLAFGLGGLLAIASAIVGNAVGRPVARRLGELSVAATGAPSDAQRAEVASLQARLGRSTTINAVLLVLTASLMAIARYL